MRPPGRKTGGAGRRERRKRGDDSLRHQGGGVGSVGTRGGEAGVEGERAVEGEGIGIDEELGGIEPEALVGGVGAVGAEPVGGAGRQGEGGGEGAVGGAVERDPVELALAVEGAGPDALGGARPDGDAECRRGGRGAEGQRRGQVMTSGSARPVRSLMPARVSAARIRSARASAVSMPRRSGSAS